MDKTTRTQLDRLHSEERELQNEAFTNIIEATERPVEWAYEAWDELLRMLTDKDNHERAIGAQVLCNLAARSDPKGRILRDFPALLAVTRDERFVTARHTLQAIWKVGLAGKKQQKMVVDGLEGRFPLRSELAFDPHEGRGSGEDLLQFLGLISQNGRQFPAQTVGVLDLGGMRHHRRDPGADGHLLAPAIQDRPSHRQNRAGLLILPGGLLPQLRAQDHLEIKEATADDQSQQDQTEAYQADADARPFADGRVHGRLTTW